MTTPIRVRPPHVKEDIETMLKGIPGLAVFLRTMYTAEREYHLIAQLFLLAVDFEGILPKQFYNMISIQRWNEFHATPNALVFRLVNTFVHFGTLEKIELDVNQEIILMMRFEHEVNAYIEQVIPLVGDPTDEQSVLATCENLIAKVLERKRAFERRAEAIA